MSQTPSNPSRDGLAANEDRTSRGPLAQNRLIVVSMGVVALLVAWCYMTVISRDDPWYRNTDMNIHNMVDALSINSSTSPNRIDQPALPTKYLLALDYRVQHYLGQLPVWNLKKLAGSKDPLREIPPLIRLGRTYSRVLVIICILCASFMVYSIMRTVESASLTVILMCSSTGLLFHGLLVRPELLCTLFGNILALLCVWRSTSGHHWLKGLVWLFFAGVFGGLSALNKMPGTCYIVVCGAWCFLAALIGRSAEIPSARVQARADLVGALLSLASALATLGLLAHLAGFPELAAMAVFRLRLLAVIVGILPLGVFCVGRHPRTAFIFDRIRELGVLGGGALGAIVLSFLALRAVMSEPGASQYMAGVVHTLFYPEDYLPALLNSRPDGWHEFAQFFQETPLLFISAPLVVLGVCVLRPVPLRLKGFLLLLPAIGLGMAVLMTRRYFADQYSIFAQVPLLLAWSIGLATIEAAWRKRHPREGLHWAVPIAVVVALVLMLAVYIPLGPKYRNFQADAQLPVSHLTITFLYDHDAHAARYLQIMQDHYGDRAHFAEALDRYLNDPANRY